MDKSQTPILVLKNAIVFTQQIKEFPVTKGVGALVCCIAHLPEQRCSLLLKIPDNLIFDAMVNFYKQYGFNPMDHQRLEVAYVYAKGSLEAVVKCIQIVDYPFVDPLYTVLCSQFSFVEPLKMHPVKFRLLRHVSIASSYNPFENK